MIRSILLLLTALLWLHTHTLAQAPTPGFAAGTVAGCSPMVVRFSDQSTGSPTSWFWDFGNGATSSLKEPSTTYFVPGKYTVTLTVTNSDGSKTATKTDYITVYGNPEVALSVPDSIGCYPFPVQFTDASTASPGTSNTSWVWDLGDGTQSTEQHPRTIYQHDGSYTVSLKVTNDKGCFSVATKHGYIKINGGIKTAFNFQPPNSCRTPFILPFNNTTTGPGQLSYTWHFGDGTTSAAIHPTHTYDTTGTFSVMLVTQSSEGCIDTLRKENLLHLENTTTSFSVPDSVCALDGVTFSNTSSAPAAVTRWDFGDGTTSATVSPVKAFTTPGTYTVRLQQQYAFCTDSASKTVHVSPKPVAGFTADRTVDCQTPLKVSFQNTSTGAVSYLWNFGDGTTSTDENPTHTYTAYGSFPVTLKATNLYGCTDTYRMPGAINVNKPSITFTSLPVSGCVPFPTSFVANIFSPDSVVSYLWDFGNGVTSTATSPSYTYTEQGTYTVRLTVTTANGCTETYELAKAVTVGTKPEVKFSAVPNPVCAFQSVQFVNQSVSSGTWHWFFGDGGTSTQQNPLYQYGDTGTFDVKLIADNNGCRDSLEVPDYITVKPPIARFNFRTSCTSKLVYAFTDNSIGATAWLWDFGDGTTSTERNPTHTFPDYGSYTVQLTASNDTCFHVAKTTIRIVNGTPNFTALPPVACKGSPIHFAADSTNWANIVSYSWNFGNGTSGSGMATETVFAGSGFYTISLTVRDINGCLDSTVKKQLVQINGPKAAFTARNTNGCKGLEATFTDASKSDSRSKITAWEWDLGDGTKVNDSVPRTIKHVYEKPGSYDIGLMVTDAGGCADSLLMPALVRTSDIKADFVSADTTSCPGAAVRFSNTSKALTSYNSLWTFGNGATSREQHPTATFKTDDLYTVKLKITDAYGCADSVEKKDYVSIRHPEASFQVNDSTSSCIPFQVQYTNTSTYYTQHVWDLSGGTSRLLNPTQYYNSPGVYQTKLIVTSPGGCTDTATKTISVYDISASQINYLPLSGCKPLTVDLTAFSPLKMDLIWDFGDGTIISSRDTVLRHTYNFFGDFVPKLILKNTGGCVVAITGSDTIRIKGATTKFGVDNRLLCDSGLVRFSDSTTFNNPIRTYNWNFGDGTTSREASPAHYYSRPGVYPVSLNVQTQNLCVDTFRLNIPVKVVASPVIRISGDSIICAGEGITHMGLFERDDTAMVHWQWRFPNGNEATSRLPQKQYYQKAGRFAVQTIAVNSSGCKDTAVQNINVYPIPEVTLPETITTMVGTPVLIPAIYSDTMRRFQWSGADGLNCTDCPQPIAKPKMDTRYTVQFEDRHGCRNEGTVQVLVLCNNDNVFVPNTFSPNGDGSNDVFYVRGKGLSRVKSLRIFNRWGQAVFERVNFNVNDPAMGWDGRYKGAKAIPDVYVYQVEIFCDNSQVVKFEGNVALIQ